MFSFTDRSTYNTPKKIEWYWPKNWYVGSGFELGGRVIGGLVKHYLAAVYGLGLLPVMASVETGYVGLAFAVDLKADVILH